MSIAIICDSIVFVGIGTFIVLFMHVYRGVPENLANASLFIFYIMGAFGTAVGGHLAKRWQRTAILRWSYLLSIPLLAGMFLIPGPIAWIFIVLVALTLYVQLSLQVTLGARLSTAAHEHRQWRELGFGGICRRNCDASDWCARRQGRFGICAASADCAPCSGLYRA